VKCREQINDTQRLHSDLSRKSGRGLLAGVLTPKDSFGKKNTDEAIPVYFMGHAI